MDTVLGLSMTSAGVSWVLVQGSGADAITLDHDHFSVDDTTGGDITRHQAAVRGARAIAEFGGHRVTSVGVTFTNDVEAEATALLNALPDMGFENVVPVSPATAAETWAQAFGRTLGFERCALCVVEPSAVTVVSVLYNFVRTATTQMRGSADDIGRWLTSVFEVNRSQPETLYLLGARDERDSFAGPLEEVLPIPVVASDDAQLSLARGAALSVEPELAARAQPKPDNQKTVRIATPRRRLFDRLSPHARIAAGIAIGLAGLLAVGATLVGESSVPGQLDRSPMTTEAAAASVESTPSMSIHSVPSAPATPVTVQRAAAPLPAPPQALPVVERPVIEQPAEQPVEQPVAVEQPATVVAEPVTEELPAVAPEPVQPLAHVPEPHAVSRAIPAAPGPAVPPEAAPAVVPEVLPAAPPPPEVLPPAPAPVPPSDPLQAALSPLFGGLP